MKRLFFIVVEILLIAFAVGISFVPAKFLIIPVDFAKINAVKIQGAPVEYYDIRGNSQAALNKEIEEKGQNVIGGAGQTRWSIQWVYRETNPNSPECFISDITVTYKVKVILPRWIDPQDGNYGLIWEWEDGITKLSAHEQHHVDILLENYESVKKAIETSTCDASAAAASQAYDNIKKMQEKFDQETEHGTKQ